MYQILITPEAKKELEEISKLYRKAIAESIDTLKDDPYQGKSLSRELSRRYSYRIGVYRIVYSINEDDKIVTVLVVGHRAHVYD